MNLKLKKGDAAVADRNSEVAMPITEHLSELRKRIIRVIVFFFIMIIAGFLLADPLIEYLRHKPPANGYEWHANGCTWDLP